MDNIQFEITHDRLLALLAKQLDVDVEQLSLVPITSEETSAVRAFVRVDLATANKIDKKIKRLSVAEGA